MTATTLETYLLAAMHFWAPAASHRAAESSIITEARYQAIAADVASVALDLSEPPLFQGDEGRLRTAVLLLSIASFESGGFRADVAFCERAGDGGRTWGLYQSHRSVAVVCSAVREASRVALEQLRESFMMCRRGAEASGRLDAYVSGSCGRGGFAARARWERAASWIRQHPPSVAPSPTGGVTP